MMITHTKDYEQEDCITCGTTFFLTKEHKRGLLNSKKGFYCPNGHSMVYKKSTADILQEKLNIERKKNEELEQQNIDLSGQVRDLKKPKKKTPKKKKETSV